MSRFHAQRFRDIAGHCSQRVPLPIRQIDGLVGRLAAGQDLNAADHAGDTIIDIGEVQHFVFAID